MQRARALVRREARFSDEDERVRLTVDVQLLRIGSTSPLVIAWTVRGGVPFLLFNLTGPLRDSVVAVLGASAK